VALLPPLALYVGLRVHALGSLVPGLHYVPLTPGELLLNAIALLPQYARTFLWPFDLNLYHDFDAIHGAAHWSFGLGVALLLVALIVLVATVRSQPALAFGVAWALTTLSPYLFVHVPAGNVFAERYLYDPAFGVCMVLGSGWMWLRPQLKAAHVRFAAAVGAATMMMLFLALDVRRTLQWRDQVTLYTKTLSQSARAEVIRINLAVRYLELHRYDDGIAVLKELLAFAPAYRGAWYNLGLLYQAKHMTDEAIAAYEEARRTDPFDASALLNLGYLYDQRGRREEAVAAYLRLVEMEPRNAQGWYNLAVVAYEHGQLANARTAVRRVLAQSPDDAQALQREIQRRPKPATTDEDQGQTLHRCSVAKRLFDGGHFEDAISTLKAAAWLDETSALPHHYLANMYYAKGRLLVAIRHQREALRLAPQNELYRRNLTALQRALAARMPRPLE
jgi:tetratricopeptide (TPR) repeat protein